MKRGFENGAAADMKGLIAAEGAVAVVVDKGAKVGFIEGNAAGLTSETQFFSPFENLIYC